MILPATVGELPPGSVIIGDSWAAVHRHGDDQTAAYWQVTGSVSFISTPDMIQYVTRMQKAGDKVTVVRRGEEPLITDTETFAVIRAAVGDLVDDLVIRTVFNARTGTGAKAMEDTTRRRLLEAHPVIARILRDSTPPDTDR